jgi:signal recognition particle subunit SEC65
MARWELTHRLEDLADTLQELGYEFTFDSQQVCSTVARTLRTEVARVRDELEREVDMAREWSAPGRLL